jgi:CheY-like chemotaxis protein
MARTKMTGSEATVAAAVNGLTTAEGQRPRVAVVGGTQSAALVAMVLCEQFGCSAISAPTGESVLALLRRDTPLDMVVIDLSVSDMDGLVAVQLIRALGSRGALPVIALTNDRAEVAGARGFAGVVVKPYSPRELYGAMEAALTRTTARAIDASRSSGHADARALH